MVFFFKYTIFFSEKSKEPRENHFANFLGGTLNNQKPRKIFNNTGSHDVSNKKITNIGQNATNPGFLNLPCIPQHIYYLYQAWNLCKQVGESSEHRGGKHLVVGRG